MSGIDIDLLRREECKPLTTEQMNNIKSQFHPVKTVNVSFGNPSNINYYINPQTGVDDIAEGYGLSADKPFASIEYALSQTPSIMGRGSTGSLFTVTLNVQGNFTSTTIKSIPFEFPNCRFYLRIIGDATFENYTFTFQNSNMVNLQLLANLTMTITNTTLTTTYNIFRCMSSKMAITESGHSTASPVLFTINGNDTIKNYLNGIETDNNGNIISSANSIRFNINNCHNSIFVNGGSIALNTIEGTGNDVGMRSAFGMIFYHTSTISATTATQQVNGGQIFYS